ncbi:hypothetical protein BEP19_06125 [Ammoniphilus oxalaticus]|uniref:Acid phosphatase n=1 Tax=Ammoniphilus oxalaticus TaxID=66863 RepID=A0A419SL35_9BACL|nr:divergent PAP2 family protein [Ammoniphilus oxalaticus]RKD24669.1 hypothetical protein BEP19_06125 [Ammoniphilus oxalaticus]
MNKGFLTAMSTIGLTQFLKLPFEYMENGKWDLQSAFKMGGMPSSHSAGVTSLATYIGLKKGLSSHEFAIAALLGLVVMYDAAGVRYHAGETAIAVNKLEEKVAELSERHPEISLKQQRRKLLKERLGHLPSEVVAGAILGMLAGGISYLLSKD